MSYATLLVYVNADHISKQLVSVAAGLADKFSAKLIGLSALGVIPPFVAQGMWSPTMRQSRRRTNEGKA